MPATRPRTTRGEGLRLRAEILSAAGAMLAERGEPADLSLRAIARAVGVTTTSLYLHFRSLDELIHEVRLEFFDEFGRALASAAGPVAAGPVAAGPVAAGTSASGTSAARTSAAGTSAGLRLRRRARAYVDYGLAHQGRYRAMFSAEIGEDLAGMRVYQTVQEDVAAAVSPGADVDLMTIQLWTALHGIVTLRAVRSQFPWPDLDRQLADLTGRLFPA
jgi:AcrR family transcriptional regulator